MATCPPPWPKWALLWTLEALSTLQVGGDATLVCIRTCFARHCNAINAPHAELLTCTFAHPCCRPGGYTTAAITGIKEAGGMSALKSAYSSEVFAFCPRKHWWRRLVAPDGQPVLGSPRAAPTACWLDGKVCVTIWRGVRSRRLYCMLFHRGLAGFLPAQRSQELPCARRKTKVFHSPAPSCLQLYVAGGYCGLQYPNVEERLVQELE